MPANSAIDLRVIPPVTQMIRPQRVRRSRLQPKFILPGVVLAVLLYTCTASPTPQVLPLGRAIRIMPLGDSITQANWRHNSYRRPLWLQLRQAGYDVDFVGSMRSHLGGAAPTPDFDQDHEGHWGWSVGDVLPKIEQWARSTQPDVVLIHLGTNNIGGQPLDRTIAELQQLIETLVRVNPKINILLAQLIPTVGVEADIAQFNQQIVRLAQAISTEQAPVLIVDQFTGFNAAIGQDTYDGLHPNEAGEQKLANRWFAALQKVLPQPSKRSTS